MNKKKHWQLFLILSVIVLTIYNISPTIFYYAKPLKTPIEAAEGERVKKRIVNRVHQLEEDTFSWLNAFCELIHVKPLYIQKLENSPQIISLSFPTRESADTFRRYLPRAGALIPFGPAKLNLVPQQFKEKEVLVLRQVVGSLEEDALTFVDKKDPQYFDLLVDRAVQIGRVLTEESDAALLVKLTEKKATSSETLEHLCSEVQTLFSLFPQKTKLASRFKARFTQGNFDSREKAIESLIAAFSERIDRLKEEEKNHPELSSLKDRLLVAREKVRKEKGLFSKGSSPFSQEEMREEIKERSTLNIGDKNPFFSELVLDPNTEEVFLKWHRDVASFLQENGENSLFDQLLMNELAKISRLSEAPSRVKAGIKIALTKLQNSSSYIAVDLKSAAEKELKGVQNFLQANWLPRHPDLKALGIYDQKTYASLPLEKRSFALVFSAPVEQGNLEASSLYVVGKGVHRLFKNLEMQREESLFALFSEDFQKLSELLRHFGFIGYFGSTNPKVDFADDDFIFEKRNFALPLLQATREEMVPLVASQKALLELSNVEERILKENKIDTEVHKELLKWRDEYQTAALGLNPHTRFDFPKPTKNIFWSNLALSWRKILRGDERKVLRWGLDLSGGKTVQVELRDQNGEIVKDPQDLKQGVSELTARVNKMGVSEVSIRLLGHQIALDFPGAQALSAEELIQPSSMQFHIVNEKFSERNPRLKSAVQKFLQEVWNEALVKGRKDSENLHKIAYEHLHGKEGLSFLRSEAAEMLWSNNLRLSIPGKDPASSDKETSLSRIVRFRSEDLSEWYGQTHPLLIIFHNFALEGSHLENIQAQYDPSKGNALSFTVKRAFYNAKGEKIDPRANLYQWTSAFSKEGVVGKEEEGSSLGSGWRMAALFNQSIISAPTLSDSLKDSGVITGHFSQREVQLLASDLKAGSLTFTPHILSEKNISPELGLSDRIQGITATIAALLLVVFAMVAYYRFAGVIASLAVLFNLLILWGVLQNLNASLSLAGIAGIILTVGMAVDANVLVFERFKEEFAVSKNLKSAISAGYKKAFSAIVDSNVTTIIAALILLNFDAGPIKSFAINLIIGIASSMFTALFMTRYYFTHWAQNPSRKALSMGTLFDKTRFDFLKKTKLAFSIASLLIVTGLSFLYVERGSILGMDFTGGYALNIELTPVDGGKEIARVEKAFQKIPQLERGDFQIQELTPSNHLRILLGTSLEEKGKPFYRLPLEEKKEEMRYAYEKNPRISWVVAALQSENLELSENSKLSLDKSWVAMSSQMSDSMRKNAVLGLLLSFVGIFIYLTFRFESKFGMAALFCLLHDVLISLGTIGLLHKLGIKVQIDLSVVAAIMTIIGYSLNDTIIIFDRIREELAKPQRKSLKDLINDSLNATLSRTTITSGTTLIVLLALVTLGGASIFSFSLVMTLGVIFGTLSSWFIAAPFFLFLHRKEEKSRALT